jgi:hypothetical protein
VRAAAIQRVRSHVPLACAPPPSRGSGATYRWRHASTR